MSLGNLGKIAIINMTIHDACDVPERSILNDITYLDNVLSDIVDLCHLTVLETSKHTFSPYGVTMCKILSESHISIHTWPELHSCAIDVYSCKDDLDDAAIEAYLRSQFSVVHLNRQVMIRHLGPT